MKIILDREITLTTNKIIDLASVIVCVSSVGCTLGNPTESTNVVNSSHSGYCLMQLKSRTAWEGLRLVHFYFR